MVQNKNRAGDDHGPNFEPEAKDQRPSFLHAGSYARRGSNVSAAALNLFRSRSKSDGVLPNSSVTASNLSTSLACPVPPRIATGPVPFDLQKPPILAREPLYDIDVVAVHAYGEDLQSAWTTAVVAIPENAVDEDMYDWADLNHDQRLRSISQHASDQNLIKASSKVDLTSSANLTVKTLHEQPLDEVHKAELTHEWVLQQEVPTPVRGRSLDPTLGPQLPKLGHRVVRWLRDQDWLPGRISNARVLLFQYGVPTDDGKPPSLTDVTKSLATRLEQARRDDPNRPIFFIGHDFGIIVIEATLVELWREGFASEDSPKDRRAFENICEATAGIVCLATEVPQTDPGGQLDYFDVAIRRRPGFDLQDLPYAETKRDQFLGHHLDSFKALTQHLAETRPAMTLKCFMSTGKIDTPNDAVYGATLKLIANAQQEYGLLVSACTGQLQTVKWYLKEGRSPNTQNDFGQSALLLAVRNGRQNVVRLLVRTFNADVGLCDRHGQTPLHLAVMYHSERQELIEMLLKRGADVTAKNLMGVSPLDLVIERDLDPAILKKRPPVDGPSENSIPGILNNPIAPRLSSAIHACHFFRATLAEFYIVEKRERFIYDQPSVHEVLYESGPYDILDAVRAPTIEKEPIRCRWFHLPANNVAWIVDLFVRMKISADPLVENQHEGPTPWSHYMRPQARLFRPIKHSQNSRGHWIISEQPGRHYMVFMPYLNYEAACDQNVLYKVIQEGPSLEAELLAFYEAVQKASPVPKLKIDTKMKQSSRFLSIPQTAEASPHSMDPSPHPEISADKLDDLLPTKSPPNLDQFLGASRVYSNADEDWQGVQRDAADPDRLRKEKALIRGYLYEVDTSKGSIEEARRLGPLHIRRTLDQSHYFMLTSTKSRDKDQVVLRGARNPPSTYSSENNSVASFDLEAIEDDNEPAYSEKEPYPLVMVDQLWLWVIGDTVVTCFPEKWTQDRQQDRKQESDVLEELLHYLRTNKRRALVREPQDLVNVIVSQCAGVFNKRRAKLGLALHDHFESSVGKVADREMKLFRRFELASRVDPTTPETKEAERKRLDKLFDIYHEVKLLDETKDIRDELRMILRVVNDQALVMTDMASLLKQNDGQDDTVSSPASPDKGFDQGSLHNITTTVTEGAAEGPIRSETFSVAYKNRHPIIDANIRDFDRMLAHANASYEALNHLLDLKQKHANATEARFTRKGAEETARQGNTIMFFTIVTIIFGSSSFVTAFFALNITAFPKDKNNSSSWNLGPIGGVVAGISIGLATPFIIIAFNINSLLALRNKRKREPDYKLTSAYRKSVFIDIITFRRLRLGFSMRQLGGIFRVGRKKKQSMKHNDQGFVNEKDSKTTDDGALDALGAAAGQSVDVDQASHEVVYSPTAGTQQ